jgi:surfeit locus 1 family protein
VRTWHARWPMALVTIAACVLFGALGRWQWQRGEYRSAQWQTFTAADVAPRDASPGELAALPRFTRVRLHGRFDVAHQVLLENISEGGRAGYYVLTPLLLADGTSVLVNRGFIPGTGYLDQLPSLDIPDPDATRTVVGRTGALPVAGIAAGRVPPPAEGPWPRRASFPTEADVAAVLPARPAASLVLLEEDADGAGLARHWQPPGLEPARHYSYAVQWWAFAVLAAVIFLVLNFRKVPKP